MAFRLILSRAFACLAALLFLTSTGASAQGSAVQEKEKVYLSTGTYLHFSSSDDHEGPRILGGVEWRRPSDWLYGLTLFNNSFDQFSQYVYVGKRFELPWHNVHAKLTGGLIHGYKGRFRDKIPLNGAGFAPAIIPSLGMDFGRFEANVGLLGLNGVMFSLGYDVWK